MTASLSRAADPATQTVRLGPSAARPERRVLPVKAWAAFGVLCVAFEIYLFGSWILSGDATPTPAGPTPVPTWMRIVLHGWEIGGLFAFAAFLWFFMIRPWRRAGHVTLDGLFCIAFLSLYWQDPLLNYFQPWLTYNAELTNWGSWMGQVPGVGWPTLDRFAEPVLWTAPIYTYLVFGAVVVANLIMRAAKARWPRLGPVDLALLIFALFVVFDAVLEPFFLRLGIYSYPGAIPGATINAGHYYQFPLYEAPLWGGTWAAWACCRYFRNDKGETLAERGLSEIRTTTRRRTGIRFLALVGILNAVFLVLYNIPSQFVGLKSGAWPQDIQSRSYLTNGLCGPSTAYACPGPKVPVPRPDSGHLDPSGNLRPAD